MNVVEAELTHSEELEQLDRKPRPEKVAEVERLAKVIQESRGVFLTDFRGINVERMNDLRARFREAGVDYRIIKNNLLKRAADDVGLADWIADLEGPTAMAVGVDDPIASARVIRKFREAYRREGEFLNFKGGLLAGEIIDETTFMRLAMLPSREELIAKLLYLLTYPMRGLVTVLSGLPRNLVYALEDLRSKRVEETPEETPEEAPEEAGEEAPAEGEAEAEAPSAEPVEEEVPAEESAVETATPAGDSAEEPRDSEDTSEESIAEETAEAEEGEEAQTEEATGSDESSEVESEKN
jgi:large subunit ribosomal protein L10